MPDSPNPSPSVVTVEGEHDDVDVELAPERGSLIGRFLMLGTLGMGGMGVVLSAYDPNLDRKVALKLLRGDAWHGEEMSAGRAAIEREAKAMARLTHPNVVAVYEVGFVARGAYVVMEQVEGVTLRAWLRAKERGWREILDVLLAAGAGLAAAHDAGVVHQDFKPENVLVGDDGRPRVSDFGLAGSGILGAGTRGYASPEQEAAEVVDARTDQFAFCVTLWEALHGERPVAGTPPPVSRRKVPERIHRALRRGLARQRDDRWPSMAALLAALRAPSPARAWLVAGAATAALGLGAAGFLAGSSLHAPVCGGAEARLAGVWDAARKAQVGAAFAATGLPYHDVAWRLAGERIDAYAGEWARMYTEACRATHVEGRQSDSLLDLRMACLDRRRAGLGALTALWAKGLDAAAVDAAPDAAGGLGSLGECADVRALTEKSPLPEDVARRARIEGVRVAIDQARALMLSSRVREARAAAKALPADAAVTGWPQVQAEAALIEGQSRSYVEEPGADGVLLQAYGFAGQSHDDVLAAEALITLVKVLGDQGKTERALAVAEIADRALAAGGDDDELRLDLLRFQGAVLRGAGRYPEALAVLESARARAVAAYGPGHPQTLQTMTAVANAASGSGNVALARQMLEDLLRQSLIIYGELHPQVSSILNLLGIAIFRAGDTVTAIATMERALAVRQQVYGAEAQPTLAVMNNLAELDLDLGRHAEARALLEKVLAVRLRALGPDSPRVATVRDNLGVALAQGGQAAEAVPLHLQALAVLEKTGDGASPEIADVLDHLGASYAILGDEARALEAFRRALDLRSRALGAAHFKTLTAMGHVAGALARLGRCPEAGPLATQAIDGLERSLGPDSVAVLDALVVRASCALAGGDAISAQTDAERAEALGHRLQRPPVVRGRARFVRARALWALGRRDDALAAARLAERELAEGAGGARDLDDARRWIAGRR